MKHKKRIGIALGGGGARGFAHLGILQALDSAGIDIDVYAGTSMGAIIAVANLQRRNFHQSEISLQHFVNKYSTRFATIEFSGTEGYRNQGPLSRIIDLEKKLIKFITLLGRTYVDDGKVLREISDDFIYPCNLEDLPKKVFVCVSDIVTGQGVFMSRGSARQSIRAAMSIAGSFPGVRLGNRILVDGSAVYPVPIHAFMFEPVDIIIGCDVGVEMNASYTPASAIDLMFRQYDMLYGHVASEVTQCADLVIHPHLSDIHWTDFKKLEAALERGYEAGEKSVPLIKELISSNIAPTPMSARPWHKSGCVITPWVEDNFPPM